MRRSCFAKNTGVEVLNMCYWYVAIQFMVHVPVLSYQYTVIEILHVIEAYASFYSHCHFVLIHTLPSNLLVLTMVQTRSQLENLSKDELVDEVLSLENFKNDINVKFSKLDDCFNDFQAKYEMVNSNLSISRCCNELLLECITH